MNFFEKQQSAKTTTVFLVIIFCVSVGITSFFLAGLLCLLVVENFYAAFCIAFVLHIALAVYLYDKLSKFPLFGVLGGQLLSDVRVTLEDNQGKDRQLLNIVTEMSLASGVPVPRCAVIRKSQAVNSFVSGRDSNDIVLTVTQGSLDQLSRDELQTMVAHEFSHILNHDVLLNHRLTALVGGLMLSWMFGILMVRAAFSFGRIHFAAILIFLIISLFFFIIGSVGFFFGSLCQCLVARQRKYLADASAVQFTRNSEALGRVFAKVLDGQIKSDVESKWVGEASHIFFLNPIESSIVWKLLPSAHPSLEKRFREIMPGVAISSVIPEKLKADSVPLVRSQATSHLQSNTMASLARLPSEESLSASSKFMNNAGISLDVIDTHSAAFALLELIVTGSRSEGLGAGETKERSLNISASTWTQFESAIAADERNQTMLLQIVLSKLNDSSTELKERTLLKMKTHFEGDGRWSFREALMYLLAEKVLYPISFVAPLNMISDTILLRCFEYDDVVDLKQVRDFILGWRMAPLEKRKELLDSVLLKIGILNARKKEELRLLSIIFGIPIPV